MKKIILSIPIVWVLNLILLSAATIPTSTGCLAASPILKYDYNQLPATGTFQGIYLPDFLVDSMKGKVYFASKNPKYEALIVGDTIFNFDTTVLKYGSLIKLYVYKKTPTTGLKAYVEPKPLDTIRLFIRDPKAVKPWIEMRRRDTLCLGASYVWDLEIHMDSFPANSKMLINYTDPSLVGAGGTYLYQPWADMEGLALSLGAPTKAAKKYVIVEYLRPGMTKSQKMFDTLRLQVVNEKPQGSFTYYPTKVHPLNTSKIDHMVAGSVSMRIFVNPQGRVMDTVRSTAVTYSYDFGKNNSAGIYKIISINRCFRDTVSVDVKWLYSAFTSVDAYGKKSISAYPNPVVDFLRIEGATESRYMIYNLAGKLVANGVLSDQINMSSFTSGVYFLKVEGFTQPLRVIKQ